VVVVWQLAQLIAVPSLGPKVVSASTWGEVDVRTDDVGAAVVSSSVSQLAQRIVAFQSIEEEETEVIVSEVVVVGASH
jgi:hypothetical protein